VLRGQPAHDHRDRLRREVGDRHRQIVSVQGEPGERERQRQRRERLVGSAALVPVAVAREVEAPPPGGEVSRAEFAAQVRAITSVIVANVDRAAALSRAEFGRQVSRIVKEGAANLGRACA
jgi:hypothetical protein